MAGAVLGKCRRFYCLYGDTVNMAARMAAQSKPDSMCVSSSFFQQISAARPAVTVRGEFEFVTRGPVDIKGKGAVEVYVVCGPLLPANPILSYLILFI